MAFAPMPPRRPDADDADTDAVAGTVALAYAPLPPARPGSLADTNPIPGIPELRGSTEMAAIQHPLPPPRPDLRPVVVASAAPVDIPVTGSTPKDLPKTAKAKPAPDTGGQGVDGCEETSGHGAQRPDVGGAEPAYGLLEQARRRSGHEPLHRTGGQAAERGAMREKGSESGPASFLAENRVHFSARCAGALFRFSPRACGCSRCAPARPIPAAAPSA